MDDQYRSESPIRVMALHALAYSKRLSFLEEAEEIRVSNDRVYGGRTLHEGLDANRELTSLTLETERLSLMGTVGVVRVDRSPSDRLAFLSPERKYPKGPPALSGTPHPNGSIKVSASSIAGTKP